MSARRSHDYVGLHNLLTYDLILLEFEEQNHTYKSLLIETTLKYTCNVYQALVIHNPVRVLSCVSRTAIFLKCFGRQNSNSLVPVGLCFGFIYCNPD